MDLISPSRRPGAPPDAVDRFAAEVGLEDAVVALGGGTSGDLGGAVAPSARVVRAPVGIVGYLPEEMIVRCGAGTKVADLRDALAEHGQRTALPVASPASTVGGTLAAARSDVRRLRLGAARDSLLEARYVSAEGQVVRTGAAVVKNVTGFDLCRLLCGSWGTLGLFGEVALRTLPVAPAARWLAAKGTDPLAVLALLYRPSAVLWDGTTTWVLLEGHDADIAAETAVLGDDFSEVAGPPDLPVGAARRSLRPDQLPTLVDGGHCAPGSFVAEIGVGTVHSDDGLPGVPRPEPDRRLVELHTRLKANFDPTGRLAPGRDPLAV